MANIRQSIIIRTDLNLPVGLLAAQVAHLSMEKLRYAITHLETFRKGAVSINFPAWGQFGADFEEWLLDPYLFVHKVPNKEALDYFSKEFQRANIPVSSWVDTITLDISPTQKKAFVDVMVGISAGPCDSDKIKAIIGDLPLL